MKAKLTTLAVLVFFLLAAQPVHVDALQWSLYQTVQIDQQPALDVPYVPTPYQVVNEMLTVAGVNSKDILYDLGCGDGRIVVTAVKERNVRKGVGVDIDPQRIQQSNENARQAGVADRVTFQEKNLFEIDLSEATVVSLYLLPTVNLKLRPKLMHDLKPGARIVSHDFDMGDWEPDRTVQLNDHTVFYWVVPANVSGTWKWSVSDGKLAHHYELRLGQHFQNIEKAELRVDDVDTTIGNIKLTGNTLEFTVPGNSDRKDPIHFKGSVKGNKIQGRVSCNRGCGKKEWNAGRDPSTAVAIDTTSEKWIQL